jgi:LacI family transcriptional regulator
MRSSLTIEEIAVLAEVSRSTVSRVLNNHPSVRASVRDRVLQVMRENNYTPNAAARSLASSRASSLGLLIPNSADNIFADLFFPVIIQSVIEASNELGYFVMLAMLKPDVEQDFFHRIVRGHHFDGLIMLSSHIDDPMLPLLIRDRTPLVLIGSHPYFEHVDWVDIENRAGARLAVNHLIGVGHRRIATITGSLEMVAGIDRREGYTQALMEAGLPIDPALLVPGNFKQHDAYAAMQQLLRLPERPTAVFIASDTMTIGALRAIREAGLRVPEDIAIVSFDDLPLASFSDVPLTTIHQPVAQMGATAARVLINKLEQQNSELTQIRLPGKLIVRQSCGALGQPAMRRT